MLRTTENLTFKMVLLTGFLINTTQSLNLVCSSSSQTSWGSCALVGSSVSLLSHKLGEDIDNHNTVLRFGWPRLTQVQKNVYGLKQDVAIFRPRSKAFLKLQAHECVSPANDVHPPSQPDSYSNLITLYPQHGALWPVFKRGRKVLRPFMRTCEAQPSNFTEGAKSICALRIPTKFLLQFYSKFCEKKLHGIPPRPMTGAAYATALLLSNVCESVSVFGMADPKFNLDEHSLQIRAEHSLKCEREFMEYLDKTYENFHYIT